MCLSIYIFTKKNIRVNLVLIYIQALIQTHVCMATCNVFLLVHYCSADASWSSAATLRICFRRSSAQRLLIQEPSPFKAHVKGVVIDGPSATDQWMQFQSHPLHQTDHVFS